MCYGNGTCAQSHMPSLPPPFLHIASDQNWMVGRSGNEASIFGRYILSILLYNLYTGYPCTATT